MSLGVPTVPDIVPATAVPMFVLGKSNCGWLNTLKNSERNWSLTLSVIGNSLKTEKSMLVRPGARSTPRPEFPNVYSAGVPQGAPGVSSAVLNQRVNVGLSRLGSPVRFGRLPVPVLATGLASDGVKGNPVCRISIMFSCQLPSTAFTQRCGA